MRAYKIAMTPPMGPVALVANGKLQEEPIDESNLRIPKLTPPAPPQGDSGAIAEAAKLLVTAENPVIVAGRARAHAQRHQAAGGTGRNAAGAGERPAQPHEFPDAPSAVRTSATSRRPT